MSSTMQIQMAQWCLLPLEPCYVQMSNGQMRACKATSSTRELSIPTETQCISFANLPQTMNSALLSANYFATLVLLAARLVQPFGRQ